MFISDRFQLVFFEVPRTASNSVTVALTELDPDSPTVALRSKTNRFEDYHRFHVPTHALDYRRLAAHRNPYARPTVVALEIPTYPWKSADFQRDALGALRRVGLRP